MYSTTHIVPSSRLIYRSRQRSYNLTGIKVSIGYSSAVSAFKTLVGSFTYVLAGIACLGSECRRNDRQRHTTKLSLVGQIISQLIEIPFTKFSPKLFIPTFACKSNTRKVFNSNPLTLLFSRLNNRFCNGMIYYRAVSTFFARKPFKKFSRITSAFALNTTPNLLPMFTITVKPISGKLNIVRSMSHGSYTQVNSNKLFHIINIILGNINSLKKVKFAFLVNQISLPFDVRNVVRIMTNKINLLSTTNTPQRNHVVRLVSHYSTVISNTTKWLKGTFSFLIQLISISNFSNLPYKHLRRKFKSSFVSVVCSMMEFKIIENLFLPSYIRNGITNSISFLHRIEKQVNLFISRQKFYFQCEFHTIINTYKYTKSFLYQKIIINFVKQFKAWQAHTSRAFGISWFPALIL